MIARAIARAMGSYCVLPWTQLFVAERGALFPCCLNRREVATDGDGNTYRVQRGGLAGAWNSPGLMRFRSQLLAGARPASCRECFDLEDAGGWSYRMRTNLKSGWTAFAAWRRARPDGFAAQPPLRADLRMGDLCNLRCRMCSPVFSSGLLAEYTALFGPREDVAPAHGDGAWYRSEAFLEEFRRLAPRLVFVNFAGGEPWLVADTFKLLRMLVDTGRAGHIRLSFNTNATRVPPEAYELFPRFRGVAVHCSVDGFGRVNDYIRSPSRWEDVVGVLRELDRERVRLNLDRLDVSTVVQAYNVLGLSDLVRFLQEDFALLAPYPMLNPVGGQPHLNVSVLPPELKEEAARRLKELRTASRNWRGSLSAWVRGVVFRKQADVVLSRLREPVDARSTAEFIRVTREMDGFRGQSLADYIPELGGYVRGS